MYRSLTLCIQALIASVLGVAPVLAQSATSRKDPDPAAKLLAPKIKPLASKQLKAIKEQLKALFLAKTEVQRRKIRQQLIVLPQVKKVDAGKLAKYCFRLASMGYRIPRGSSFAIPVGSEMGTVHVSGSPGRGKGLFIGLHGGGRGTGDGRNSRQKWQGAVSAGCVCLFPTVLPNKTWSDPIASTYVNQLIEAAKRSWGIDTNRVYLAGHSMGGFGTWQNGCHSADRFAAISPNAGGGFGKGVPRNLYNLPIYFFHSTDDRRVPPASDQANARELGQFNKQHPKGYTYVYKEYHNIGHGLPRTGLGPIIKWVTGHRRVPYPRKLIWEARDEMNRQFYWLFSEKPESHGLITAEFRNRNLLAIQCKSAQGLTVMLSPKLVDFSKPLKILVNGKEMFHGYAPHSVWASAVSIRRRNDMRQYFLGHVRLEGGGDSEPEEGYEVKEEDDED